MKRQGTVIGVCLSQKRTDPKKNIGTGLLQAGWGLEGDSHAGTEKEISLLAEEEVQALCREFNITAEPGSFAENIRTEGIDLSALPIGATLQIGKAKLQVVQIGKDPTQPHTYRYRGHSLLPVKGVFGRVIESGEVKMGDLVGLPNPSKMQGGDNG
ncbi:MAG: MOSC domain-containing protein [Thermodesulfobacteriota bacterium]